jgi:hypothetical protein
MLPTSQTLISKRFYAAVGTSSIYCRHLQVRLDFIPENFKNELLTLSLFGALHVKE